MPVQTRKRITARELIQAAIRAENPPDGNPTPRMMEEIQGWMERGKSSSNELILAILEERRKFREAQAHCSDAANAAENLQGLLHSLLEGNATQTRIEAVIDTDQGPRAVCRVQGQVVCCPIHPELDIDEVRALQSWEYASIHENVVVDVWRDDPYLYESAHGDIVSFRGFVDPESGLARIERNGQGEGIAMLSRELHAEDLPVGSRLVLQRDDSRHAIARVPDETAESRFFVPIDGIDVSFDDLAGLDPIIEEVQDLFESRVLDPARRLRFGLDEVRGMLFHGVPGTGKTCLAKAIAKWLYNRGIDAGFCVELHIVKPGSTKSMWHGEDARIIREELWGKIRARERVAKSEGRGLVSLIALDEMDTIGRRRSGTRTSAAETDALSAMLTEIDGMETSHTVSEPLSAIVCIGMSNRLDLIDQAVRREGRFGDLVKEMPRPDLDAAVAIAAVHARGAQIPWYLNEEIRVDADTSEIAARVIRPALANLHGATVMTYATDSRGATDVSAGEVLVGAQYRAALTRAKARAEKRDRKGRGLGAICFHDVAEALVETALDFAEQCEADPSTLQSQLGVDTPIVRVTPVRKSELVEHRYVRAHSA